MLAHKYHFIFKFRIAHWKSCVLVLPSRCFNRKLANMKNNPQRHFLTKNVEILPCIFKTNVCFSTSSCDDFEKVKQILERCLDDAIKTQNTYLSILVPTNVIEEFCETYNTLSPELRQRTILYLCDQYGVKHEAVMQACDKLLRHKQSDRMNATYLQSEERLRSHLQPMYTNLFKLIGRLNDGVKFLTDLRKEALEFTQHALQEDASKLRDFSNQLKSLLAIWFSVGLLNLTRITWETSADVLEKIAKDEAVHSVRGWTDLKNRLGSDRRCYAFFHGSMPRVPLLLLHVALTDEISDKISDIVDCANRKATLESNPSTLQRTAIFYSITSTQKGLQGIEFGIHMIRAVVQEMLQDLPDLMQFSSLSPIPRFSTWLRSRVLQGLKEDRDVFEPPEIIKMKDFFQISSNRAVVEHILKVLADTNWARNENVVQLLKGPLMRLCACYLHEVKIRGSAFDPVANFHLRNGATLWRINWMADLSAKGLAESYGIMVNYRYFLSEMEENSRRYMLYYEIPVSEKVLALKTRPCIQSPL